MSCPRCVGLVVELIEQDEDGEYCECLRCLNCGMRQCAVKTGKLIEVRKGEYFNQRPY